MVAFQWICQPIQIFLQNQFGSKRMTMNGLEEGVQYDEITMYSIQQILLHFVSLYLELVLDLNIFISIDSGPLYVQYGSSAGGQKNYYINVYFVQVVGVRFVVCVFALWFVRDLVVWVLGQLLKTMVASFIISFCFVGKYACKCTDQNSLVQRNNSSLNFFYLLVLQKIVGESAQDF
eukprot:TRINITY_DN15838_c0_g1_i1.p2 TRINITY_DN15838_c0_g1~~TRINITY_DN15838_c0_g1_i1.p2  ORF type:complete len:177 (-),score=12.82 TRINITY_DN15838_c0_g1_i1:47-577(-)